MMKINDKLSCNPTDIVDVLNNYFSFIAEKSLDTNNHSFGIPSVKKNNNDFLLYLHQNF
jgi:hypothetical protein